MRQGLRGTSRSWALGSEHLHTDLSVFIVKEREDSSFIMHGGAIGVECESVRSARPVCLSN